MPVKALLEHQDVLSVVSLARNPQPGKTPLAFVGLQPKFIKLVADIIQSACKLKVGKFQRIRSIHKVVLKIREFFEKVMPSSRILVSSL